MKNSQNKLKTLFVIYIFAVAILGLFIKYSFEIIEYGGLFNAFDKNIPIYFVIIFSSFMGHMFFKFGFDNKNFGRLKKIIGYTSLIGSIIFVNVSLCFILLVAFNSLLNKSDKTYSFKGKITVVESYKLSRTISVYDDVSKKTIKFSVDKKYNVGEYVSLYLKRGNFDIYYK